MNTRSVTRTEKLKHLATQHTLLLAALLCCCAVAWGWFLSAVGFSGAVVLLLVFLALPVLAYSFKNIRFGIYVNMTFVLFYPFFERMTGFNDIPFGTLTDVWFLALFLVMIAKRQELQIMQYRNLFRHPIIILFIISFLYTIIQVANPYMYSMVGYGFGFWRFSTLFILVLLSYYVFDTKERVKGFFKYWMIIGILSALYACYQEWTGLPAFEVRWVNAEIARAKLIILFGNYRKFSFFSDPTLFGILMAVLSLAGAVLIFDNHVRRRFKPFLVAGVLLMLLGMAYSGTRTAYALIPAGAFVIALFRVRSPKTILVCLGAVFLMLSVIFLPIHGNYTINRIRSTFRPSEDNSMNVRNLNRQRIQPYIWAHPIGGGINTAGVTGVRYNPGHTLSYFPPDNGFLRTAMETGWIGLLIAVATYYLVMSTAAKNYFRARDPEIRSYYLIITTIFFCLVLSHYTQLVIGSFYLSMLFYPLIAITIRLIEFDSPVPPELTNKIELQ